MNFDEAIAAHAKWKVRLRVFLEDPGKDSLKPDEVERDDQCDLGKWIYGEGSKNAGDAAFATLEEAHRQFHVLAGDVIRKAVAGRRLEAEAILSGEYLRRSVAVISAITAIKRHAERDGA